MAQAGPSGSGAQMRRGEHQNDPPTTFQSQTIDQLCKMFFRNEKTKLSNESIVLITEMMRIYTLEIFHRASYQAEAEGSQAVNSEHIEKILTQLLLDFA